MPISGLTATLSLVKYAPNSRGWDADVNANWDTIDAAFVSSKTAAWVTSGIFAAALIPLATAVVAGSVLPGSGLTYNTGTGALTLTSGNVTGVLGYTPENPSHKGAANGYASLDANGLIPSNQLPPIALTNGSTVADDTARLALTSTNVQPGDFVKVTATGRVYILTAADPSQSGNWIEIADDNAVQSVNGHSGTTLTLTTDDIGEGTSNLYYTTARAQADVTKAVVEGVLTGEITSHTHDTRYVKLAGSTMTGLLLLSGNPTTGLGAATKQYVDTADALKLNLAGGTLTGALILAADPTTGLGAATKNYADNNFVALTGATMTGTLVLAGDPTNTNDAANKHYVDTGLALKLNLTGGTLTGALTLAGAPTQNLHAATKLYTDTGLALKANLSGATFTGALILAADPATALGAATKQYVDTGLGNYLPLVGGTLTGTLVLAGDPNNPNDAATKNYVDNQIGASAGVTSIKFGSSGSTLTGVVVVNSANIIAALTWTPENVANKGVANGYASLDANGLIPSAQIPPIALTTGQVVADQTARLALTSTNVQPGDFVKQTDNSKTYLLAATDPSLTGSWIEIASDNAVLTVNGHSGTTVTLTTDDIGEGSTNLYFTATRVQTTGDARYLKLAGGTLTGALILAADPTTGLGAATKQYVDGRSGVASFNSRTGAITLSGTDVNTALGYTAADAAHLNGSNVDSGTVAEPRISASIARRSSKAAISFIADGPLAGWVGSNVTDYYVNLGGAKAWSKLVITSSSMATGDAVTIDILKVTTNGGAGASIFQVASKPVLNGTGTRNDGHLDWVVVLAAAMDDATLADGNAYVLQITAASGSVEDLRVEFYEAL